MSIVFSWFSSGRKFCHGSEKEGGGSAAGKQGRVRGASCALQGSIRRRRVRDEMNGQQAGKVREMGCRGLRNLAFELLICGKGSPASPRGSEEQIMIQYSAVPSATPPLGFELHSSISHRRGPPHGPNLQQIHRNERPLTMHTPQHRSPRVWRMRNNRPNEPASIAPPTSAIVAVTCPEVRAFPFLDITINSNRAARDSHQCCLLRR
jgi:hypothetical protein